MSFIIWYIYFIIIWWDALMCSNCNNCKIALHQRYCSNVRENAIREFNNFSFWELEFSIDSNKLESLIARYRSLFSNLKFYRFLDRSLVKNRCFIRRININTFWFLFFKCFDNNQQFLVINFVIIFCEWHFLWHERDEM